VGNAPRCPQIRYYVASATTTALSAHIDGVLRLLEPDRDPEAIRPKRTYAKRTRYFAPNELSRLILEALRDAGAKRQSTDEISARGYCREGL
jgi:hypothetical protein